MDDLTGPEQDVILALTEGMSIVSVVKLAADMYQRGRADGFTFGDPVGFVTLVLESLGERGLVQYRIVKKAEGKWHPDAAHAWIGLPYNVRLTPRGWAVAGYPRFHAEVGRNARRREVAPGDRTDYRTHGHDAEGSDVERLPWYEHRAVYPDHTHNYELFGVPADLEKLMSETRSWTRVTPEMEDRVKAAYARHNSYAGTAGETNLSERQVRYILSGKTSLGSLKQRMLMLIEQRGRFDSINDLYDELPGSHGRHNLVHVLHSLHSEGLVDFREVKSNVGGTTYLDIRPAKRPTNGEVRHLIAESEAEVQPESRDTPVSQPVEVVPTEVREVYPELARIRIVRAEHERQRRKAAQYLNAAELLSADDPETAELLLTKAAEAETSSLSPVEAEYLRWTEEHEQPEG